MRDEVDESPFGAKRQYVLNELVGSAVNFVIYQGHYLITTNQLLRNHIRHQVQVLLWNPYHFDPILEARTRRAQTF